MILSKDIIQEGHPTLKKVAEEVKLPLSEKDKLDLTKMLKYLFTSQNKDDAKKHNIRAAVGIAAPQINISKRMFCILAQDEEGDMHVLPLINPVITKKSDKMVYLDGGEGCLSVDPCKTGIVPRHKQIEVTSYIYDFKNGGAKLEKFVFKDYIAIIFQHEFDHLDGILFTDKIVTEIPTNWEVI